MERNTITKLFELKEGDRFYYTGDKKRVVREIRDRVYKSILKSRPAYVVFTDSSEGHQDRDVVFLRNTGDPAVKPGTNENHVQKDEDEIIIAESDPDIAEFVDSQTLGDAREFVKVGRVAGIRCPCCDQWSQIYKRQVHSSMAYGLMLLYGAGKRIQNFGEYFKPKDLIPSRQLISIVGDFAKLEFWNLIEEKTKDPENTKTRTSGLWKITEAGMAFVEERLKIQRYVFLYNDKILGFEGESIGIRDCFNHKFDFDKLRFEVIPEQMIDC